MSGLRTGIDLCSADEVANAIAEFGDRYLHRVFTEHELADCTVDGRVQTERLAARFAAKEAVVKALRPDQVGIDLKSIEIERQPGGWCEVRLTHEAAALAERSGLGTLELSITHERGMAAAVVVAHVETPPASSQPGTT